MYIYVSEVPGGRTYQFARYLSLEMPVKERDYYMSSYAAQGLTSGHRRETFGVIQSVRYVGQTIDRNGNPVGKRESLMRQLIVTKRLNGVIQRMVWSHEATPTQHANAMDMCLENGWRLHVSKVGDKEAWDHALEMHRTIEAHTFNFRPENMVKAI